MEALLRHRYVLKDNLIALIGVCLCFYFSYHLLHGSRSYAELLNIRSQIDTLHTESNNLQSQKMQIEEKVVMMRPGNVSKDLLEERARSVLGYVRKGEFTIPVN